MLCANNVQLKAPRSRGETHKISQVPITRDFYNLARMRELLHRFHPRAGIFRVVRVSELVLAQVESPVRLTVVRHQRVVVLEASFFQQADAATR